MEKLERVGQDARVIEAFAMLDPPEQLSRQATSTDERDARTGPSKTPSRKDSTRRRALRTAGFSMLRPPKGRFKMTHRLQARERADLHWHRAAVPSLVRQTT